MFDECVTWSEGKVGVYVLGPDSGLGREREGRAECARGLFLPDTPKPTQGKSPRHDCAASVWKSCFHLGKTYFYFMLNRVKVAQGADAVFLPD